LATPCSSGWFCPMDAIRCCKMIPKHRKEHKLLLPVKRFRYTGSRNVGLGFCSLPLSWFSSGLFLSGGQQLPVSIFWCGHLRDKLSFPSFPDGTSINSRLVVICLAWHNLDMFPSEPSMVANPRGSPQCHWPWYCFLKEAEKDFLVLWPRYWVGRHDDISHLCTRNIF
jgi:hypothetical protein